jgi:hypothetical protein
MGVGKLQEIIKRHKKSRFNVNLDDYLKTTQLFHNIEANNKKWTILELMMRVNLYFWMDKNINNQAFS